MIPFTPWCNAACGIGVVMPLNITALRQAPRERIAGCPVLFDAVANAGSGTPLAPVRVMQIALQRALPLRILTKGRRSPRNT